MILKSILSGKRVTEVLTPTPKDSTTLFDDMMLHLNRTGFSGICGVPSWRFILKVKQLIGDEAAVLEDAEVAVVGDNGVRLGASHVSGDDEVSFTGTALYNLTATENESFCSYSSLFSSPHFNHSAQQEILKKFLCRYHVCNQCFFFEVISLDNWRTKMYTLWNSLAVPERL